MKKLDIKVGNQLMELRVGTYGVCDEGVTGRSRRISIGLAYPGNEFPTTWLTVNPCSSTGEFYREETSEFKSSFHRGKYVAIKNTDPLLVGVIEMLVRHRVLEFTLESALVRDVLDDKVFKEYPVAVFLPHRFDITFDGLVPLNVYLKHATDGLKSEIGDATQIDQLVNDLSETLTSS